MKFNFNKYKKNSLLSKISQENKQLLIVIAVTSFFFTILTIPYDIILQYHELKPGNKAEGNIISLRDYHLLDELGFNKKKEKALKLSPIVVDVDEEIFQTQIEKIEESFSAMRFWAKTYPYEKYYGNEEIIREGKSIFEKNLGVSHVPYDSFLFFWTNGFSEKQENFVKAIYTNVLSLGYLDKKEDFDLRKKVIKRILPDFNEVTVEQADFIIGRNALKAYVRNLLEKSEGLEKAIDPLLDFTVTTIKPNAFINQSETEKRELEVFKKIIPPYYVIFKGELLVRKGETIVPSIYKKLSAIHKEEQKKFNIVFIFANFLLYFFMAVSIYIVAASSIKKFAHDLKSIIFAFVVISIVTLLTFLFNLLGILVSNNYVIYPFLIVFFVPFALSGMLLRLFLNSETAMIFIIYLAIVLLNIYRENHYISIYLLSSGFAGAYMIGRFTTRGEILKSGFKISLLSLFVLSLIFSIYNDEQQIFREHLLLIVIAVILSGIISSILVLILTPILEYFFKYTTSLKLLELSNQDHPLLKELMIKAPGTYNHSILIGNLVESAARAIKVNPLLARVSAYYHDIGKIKKPEMYIENQLSGYNKHEELSPFMSSLVVASHVKEGIELAKEYNLGQPIIDAIAQHHGTRLMTFFYAKALKQDPTVKEENFRYPGPKPKTREVALIMMADAVEAATRALEDSTPARITNLVKKITQDIFLDGQLDECELTLKDLNLVVESFSRSLMAIHHQRIDYPDIKAERENGNSKKSN